MKKQNKFMLTAITRDLINSTRSLITIRDNVSLVDAGTTKCCLSTEINTLSQLIGMLKDINSEESIDESPK